MTDSSPTQPAPLAAAGDKAEAILTAARAEFTEKGFAAARLDDIARRAGVGKGTIYLYFASKSDLFEGMVRRFLLPNLETIESLIPQFDGPTEDMIRFMVSTMAERVLETDLREVIRLLIAEGTAFPEITAFYHREVISRGIRIIGTILARGVERGEFRPGPVQNFPQLIMAPMLAAALWKSLFDSYQPLDLKAYLDAQLDLLFRGLRAV